MSNKFDPNSERAIRGMNWENQFVNILKETHEPTHVREYFESRGCDDYYELCRYEQKFGDFFIEENKSVIHFECVTVHPQNKGWFPERKVIIYGKEEFPGCSKDHDYWFAFLVTEDGNSGETVYVHRNVWQAYARKLPTKSIDGKLFRLFSAWNLKNLRSKKTDVKEVIFG